MSRSRRLLALGLVALGLPGCFHYPPTPPIQAVDPKTGYRFATVAGDDPAQDETFVILSFSGGGTRAAALSFGVLQHLRHVEIAGGRSMLDEVDVISSVSGGSFAAAYYGRFGKERFFAKFPDAVLRRKIQRDLLLRILAPWNWPRLLSPNFGRSDLADEYYDDHIFANSTYAQMLRQRPFIILNATDMSLGAQFSFVQEHFDRLCADLDLVHVSRGVTASSAFPIAFTPLTLDNYHPEEACGARLPGWVKPALRGAERFPRQYQHAVNWKSYTDPARRYVHLVDGGLADNIGLRGPEWAILADESAWSLLPKINDRIDGVPRVKRIVVIAVDAKPASSMDRDHKAKPTGIFDVLNTAATKPMENYSADTVERVRRGFKDLGQAAINFRKRKERTEERCAELAGQLCSDDACLEAHRTKCNDVFQDPLPPPAPALYLVQVKFGLLEDDDLRNRTEAIPTALQLPEEDIQDLITAADALLRSSESFQCLVKAVGGSPAFLPEKCPADPPLPDPSA